MLTSSHSILCDASRDMVYQIISQSDRWPELFEPCLEVRALERNDQFEDIEITAMINGTPARWRSRRHFLPDVFGIDGVSVEPMPLVQSMRTRWRVITANDAQCALLLEHDFEVLEDVVGIVDGVATRADAAAFIMRAIETNSTRELGNIRDVAAANGHLARHQGQVRRVCSIICEAPAAVVYDAVADTSKWPLLFDSCVSVAVLENGASGELTRIEALQGDHIIAWTTRRHYHPEVYRIDFALETPMPFLETMEGQWRVTTLGPNRSLLSVCRSFKLREGPDDPQPEMILRFLDENADAEMLAIKSFVETGDANFMVARSRHLLPFAPDRVYRALAEIRRWPEILPHCASLDVIYDDGIGQEFIMKIGSSAGAEQFRSVRTCDPSRLYISYFQPSPPSLLVHHNGSWTIRAARDGAEIVAEHRLRINSARCVEAFGDESLARNKARVRERINANTHTTVKACGDWLARGGDDAGR